MSKKLRLCFIGGMSSPFIKRDYKILQKHFDVNVIEPPKKKSGWIKYVLTTAKKVRQSDLTFSWFAGWHSLFAVLFSRIFKKRSIVVVGGYDVAYIPEINYGAFTNFKERIPAKYVLKKADLVLPFSNFSKNEVLKWSKPRNMQVVYLGVDTSEFKPKGNKEHIAITVGGIKKSNLKRKGIEIFVKAARHLPGILFIVIGELCDDSIEYLRSIAGSNVVFTGFVADEELIRWYQRAKVYVQSSNHEGFGVAVAEAMLCDCIPVVSGEGALSEVVGNCGFYSPYGNDKALADAVERALNSHKGGKARERIENLFYMEKREIKIIEIIEDELT